MNNLRLSILLVTSVSSLTLSGCFASGARDTRGHSGNGNGVDDAGALKVVAVSAQAQSTLGLSTPTLDFKLTNFASGDSVACTVSKGSAAEVSEACAADSNGNLSVTITPTGTEQRGAYTVNVKVSRNSAVASEATVHTYLHDTLNGVSHCPAAFSEDAIFSKALESMPKAGTFGAATTLQNPAIHVVFANGGGGDLLSLRRRLVANADNSLILVEREYASTSSAGVDCDQGIVLSGLRPVKVGGNFPGFTSSCKYLVVNAGGSAVCLRQSGTALIVADQFTNMQKRLFAHAYDFPFSRARTQDRTTYLSDPGYRVYLPE